MTSRNKMYDTIIIGASLSGSTTAFVLGLAGQSVLLIDPQRFPRRKACGEGLCDIGKEYLRALGLWSAELETQARPFFGYSIEFENDMKTELKAGLGSAQGFGVSRTLLDSFVQQSACEQNAVSLLPAKAKGIERVNYGWEVSTDDGAVFACKALVLANGLGATHLLPFARIRESQRRRYAVTFWFQGSWLNHVPNTVMIRHRSEGQYLITPLESEAVNVSVLLNGSKSEQKTKEQLLAEAQNFLASRGFVVKDLLQDRGVAEIHGRRLSFDAPGLYLVGDAIERMDPIGGMGMTHALYCGVVAAKAIVHCGAERGVPWYLSHRARGARVLRLLTFLSHGLNVRAHPWLRALSIHCPWISLPVLKMIRSFFPSPIGYLVNISDKREYPFSDAALEPSGLGGGLSSCVQEN